MGAIIDQVERREPPADVRCPICGQGNAPQRHCPHVRWTFDQGDPIAFARFAIETSPYFRARGFSARVIPNSWWRDNAEWIVEDILLHFDAIDGLVFGWIGGVDLLARDLWLRFRPDPVRQGMQRIDA